MNMEQQEQNPTASEKSVEEIVSRVHALDKNFESLGVKEGTTKLREIVKGFTVEYLGAKMEIVDVEAGVIAQLRDTTTGKTFYAPISDVIEKGSLRG